MKPKANNKRASSTRASSARAISKSAKAEKKNSILLAALDEFYERGFAAARMDDIAKRCHISKGTLYLYFNSKEALFNGLIELIAKPKQQQLIGMMNQATSAQSALVAMTEFMPVVIEQGQLPKLIKILIGDSGVFPEVVQNYKTTVIEPALAALSQLFHRSNQSGETHIENPELFSRLVVSPVIFSAIWKAVFATGDELGFDLKKQFQLHQKVLINSLHIDQET